MATTLDTKLSALDLVALTIWGEARGESWESRIAVALVIAHRVAHPRLKYGESWPGVVLKPWAFSCWVEAGGKTNHEAVHALATQVAAGTEPKGPNAWTECLFLAEAAMHNALVDTVKGATHYMTRKQFAADPPPWARGLTPVAEIGAHVFFRL